MQGHARWQRFLIVLLCRGKEKPHPGFEDAAAARGIERARGGGVRDVRAIGVA
jgi:hypothetical protein